MNIKNSINESLEVIRRALEDEKNDSNKIFKSANRRRSFIKPKLNLIINKGNEHVKRFVIR